MAKKKETKDAEGFVEIPFGAFDSETIGWTYTIPEGFTAKIEDGKIVVEKNESDDEKIRKEINILYSDIDACISKLLKARTDKDAQTEGRALFEMEGLMVATLQDLSCIKDYLEKYKDFQFDYPGRYFYDGEKMHFCGNPAMEEKQKEQKPADKVEPQSPISFGKELEAKMYEACNKFENHDYSESDLFYAGVIAERECSSLKQSAEWSDDFEENIRILLNDKLTWHSEDGTMSTAVLIDDKQLKDIISGIWFYVGKEALKYPSKELNVSEWSEEDEKMMDDIIDDYDNGEIMGDSLEKGCWLNSRLKSLRPQPYWKPSEEQINALAKAIIILGEQGNNKTVMYLNEIRTELKKL